MPDQFQFDRNSHGRRAVGYLSRFYRDAVSGGDTGYTVFKGGLIYKLAVLGILVLTTAALGPYAIFIIGAAVLGIGAYIVAGIKDENDRNKAEKRKIQELDEFDLREQAITAEVNKTLQKTRNIKVFLGLEDGDILSDIKETDSNDDLLKQLLKAYLFRLDLKKDDLGTDWTNKVNAKRRQNGSLPSENSLLRLLEQVSCLDRNDPGFPIKLNTYLIEKGYDTALRRRVFIAFNINQGALPTQIFVPQPSPPKNLFWKMWTGLKMGILFLGRGNTAFGLVAGSALLLGLLVGGVINWPVIIVGAGIAALSGVASVVYKHYVEQDYKKNCAKIDKGIAYHKTRYELLYKLKAQHSQIQSVGNYPELNTFRPTGNRGSVLITDPRYAHLNNNRRATEVDYVPTSVKVRQSVHTMAQAIYGGSAGMVIGIATVSLIFLLAGLSPPVAILMSAIGLPTIIASAVGTLLGARYAYILGNSTYKATQEEMKKIQLLGKERAKLEKSLGSGVVQEHINKSNQQLVRELISNYIALSDKEKTFGAGLSKLYSSREVASEPQALLDKKERILQVIEQASGIKRHIDNTTGLPSQQNSSFYQKLSLYLQEEPATAGDANALLTQLKASVSKKPPENCKVSATPLSGLDKAWSWAKEKVPGFMIKHPLPFLVTLAVAFPLGFMLFGQGLVLLPLIGIGVVLAGWGAHKVCEYQATRSKEQLNDMALKLPLIRAVSKLVEKVSPRPALGQQSVAARDPGITPLAPVYRSPTAASTPPAGVPVIAPAIGGQWRPA